MAPFRLIAILTIVLIVMALLILVTAGRIAARSARLMLRVP
jgi:hypothetical protein